MKIIFLSLVFLFSSGIRVVHSPGSRSPGTALSKPPSKYLSFPTPPRPKTNPCSRKTFKKGAPDAHAACESECLVTQTAISNFYRKYPKYRTIRWLYRKCGSVNVGKCSRHLLSAYMRICWCYTSSEKRKTPLSVCRRGITIMRKLTNVGIAIKRRLPRFGKKKTSGNQQLLENTAPKPGSSRPMPFSFASNWHKTDSVRHEEAPRIAVPGFLTDFRRTDSARQEESPRFAAPSFSSDFRRTDIGQKKFEPEESDDDDGEPEGLLLVTDLLISGKKVRAMIDTGSGVTLIHKNFAKETLTFQGPDHIMGANGQKFKIHGKTTIDVQLKNGFKIALLGLVTELNHNILLGNDFCMQYAAKIRISGKVMELSTGQTTVKQPIKLRNFPAQVSVLRSDPGGYDALKVFAQLNGADTQIILDTGCTFNIVSKTFVNLEKIRPDDTQCTIAGSATASYKGKADVVLLIEGKRLTTTASVPHYDTADSLITGNSFNKQFIEVIDFGRKIVTFKVTGPNDLVTTEAFVT